MPLFNGIISDLFPGVELPKPDYGVFLEALKDNIAKRELQPVPWFIEKIIQVRFLLLSVTLSVLMVALSVLVVIIVCVSDFNCLS